MEGIGATSITKSATKERWGTKFSRHRNRDSQFAYRNSTVPYTLLELDGCPLQLGGGQPPPTRPTRVSDGVEALQPQRISQSLPGQRCLLVGPASERIGWWEIML